MANKNHIEVVSSILTALEDMDPEMQKRTIEAVITYYSIPIDKGNSSNRSLPIATEGDSSRKNEIIFSENRTLSPKEFLREKAPKTDVERVACLGYFLTHYRDTPHFKTLDLSNLNTEAAQPKLSNAAFAVVNATNSGFLVQAAKGTKQISAGGELFVQALPDRDAAKASFANSRIKRRAKKNNSKNKSKE